MQQNLRPKQLAVEMLMEISFHEAVRNWVTEVTSTLSFYMLPVLEKQTSSTDICD